MASLSRRSSLSGSPTLVHKDCNVTIDVCGTLDGRTHITITSIGPVEVHHTTFQSQTNTSERTNESEPPEASNSSRVPETPYQSQDIPHGQAHMSAYTTGFHLRTGVALESPHSSWGSDISYDSQSGLGHPRR